MMIEQFVPHFVTLLNFHTLLMFSEMIMFLYTTCLTVPDLLLHYGFRWGVSINVDGIIRL